MDNPEKKRQIRRVIKVLNNQINPIERLANSVSIFNKIEKLELFMKAENILMYWSLEDEVSTHDFIKKWCLNKKILLPAIIGRDMEIREYTDEKSLIQSDKFNVLQPTGKLFSHYDKIDLVIVPGIAFDAEKNRIGRGKGYYDKFLPKLIAFKIGVCFQFQLINNLPCDSHDIQMDMVVTEK